MAMVVVDDSCLKQADSQSDGLFWGSAAAWRCSRHDDSSINIVLGVIIITKWVACWWITISAEEVLFSSASASLFVRGITRKNSRPIFTKLDGKVAQEPRRKWEDFDDNPNHATFGYGYGSDVSLWLICVYAFFQSVLCLFFSFMCVYMFL